jgi:hypothetical protein
MIVRRELKVFDLANDLWSDPFRLVFRWVNDRWLRDFDAI